jgi:hypothetical protein
MFSKNIYNTYKNSFDTLSLTKKFHFVTRLSLWTQDEWARGEIEKLKPSILGGSSLSDYREKLYKIEQTQPDYAHINAADARKPFLAKHPWLFGAELGLFHALHADVQYGIDLRSKQPSLKHIEDNLDDLIKNPEALAMLSTYLVDIFYLYHRFVQKDNTPLIPLPTIDLALHIPKDFDEKTRLQIYLLTHIIIGETLFYSRAVPDAHHDYYKDILSTLNTLANQHWESLTIDSKLEIALCSILLSQANSPIITKAIQEADSNFDSNLGFIVDPKKPHKNNLEWAEHRNVLYLMVTQKLN